MSRVLLIVENDPDFVRLLRDVLRSDPRLEVIGETATAAGALEQAGELDGGLVILDHYLDDGRDGLDVAPEIKERAPDAKILLFSTEDLSARARREQAVDAFLQKDDILELVPTVQRLLGL